jgi:hypothetical protein
MVGGLPFRSITSVSVNRVQIPQSKFQMLGKMLPLRALTCGFVCMKALFSGVYTHESACKLSRLARQHNRVIAAGHEHDGHKKECYKKGKKWSSDRNSNSYTNFWYKLLRSAEFKFFCNLVEPSSLRRVYMFFLCNVTKAEKGSCDDALACK